MTDEMVDVLGLLVTVSRGTVVCSTDVMVDVLGAFRRCLHALELEAELDLDIEECVEDVDVVNVVGDEDVEEGEVEDLVDDFVLVEMLEVV